MTKLQEWLNGIFRKIRKKQEKKRSVRNIETSQTIPHEKIIKIYNNTNWKEVKKHLKIFGLDLQGNAPNKRKDARQERLLMPFLRQEREESEGLAHDFSVILAEILLSGVVTKEEFEQARINANPDISNKDVLWGLLNEKILEYAKSGKPATGIYYIQAIFLYLEGGSFEDVLMRFHKDYLEVLKDTGCEKVEVVTKDCCSVCESAEKKIYAIEEAFQTEPIPLVGCTRRFEDKYERMGWCACRYAPAK